jgi:hypothetical protein
MKKKDLYMNKAWSIMENYNLSLSHKEATLQEMVAKCSLPHNDSIVL